jgi:hypothetical protein
MPSRKDCTGARSRLTDGRCEAPGRPLSAISVCSRGRAWPVFDVRLLQTRLPAADTISS